MSQTADAEGVQPDDLAGQQLDELIRPERTRRGPRLQPLQQLPDDGMVPQGSLHARHGDRHPYRTLYTTVTLTAVAVIGLLLFSTHVVPTLALFALLGLVGLSSNPVLVSLAVRYGGDAPALAASLPTSVFNVGTAVGTAIAAAAVSSPLGTLAPLVVATVAALLIFLPLTALARNDHPARRAAAT